MFGQGVCIQFESGTWTGSPIKDESRLSNLKVKSGSEGHSAQQEYNRSPRARMLILCMSLK